MANPPTIQPLTCISASTWEGKAIEQQEWLVDGMIPMLTTTSLSGDGGLGKSLLAMQLMTCGASGKRFLNKDTREFISVGLFCEDRENQLHERQSKINDHYGISYKDLVDLNYLPRVGENNSLVESQFHKPHATTFYNQFRECVLDMGAKLAVVDTAADTFSGNENIRNEVRHYVQLLNGLAHDMRGAVLLLIHPSLTGLTSGTGTSGSTAWSNSVRSRWYLEKQKQLSGDEPDDNIRVLSQKKSNYSAVDSSGMELIWEKGIFRPKLEEGGFMRKLELNQLRNKCLDVIRDAVGKNLNLSSAKNSPNYFPKLIRDKLKDKSKFSDIERVVNQLLDDGYVENSPYGSPSRNQFRLIPTDKPTKSLPSHLEAIDL